MATQPEPHRVPKIIEVQYPSDNQHVVGVQMSTHLASMYPDKSWGLGIDKIGLATKDSDRYKDYILVDIEAMKGTTDLLWIFQKLSGPLWTTTEKSRENLIPQKFREQVVTTKTNQEVKPETLPADLTGDIVSNVVAQNVDTGKALQTIITEVIAEDASPLVGQIAYVEKEVVYTFETLVVEGTASESGLLVSNSKVDPLGNGKAVKTDVLAPSWTQHHGSDWDPLLVSQLPYTEQFVPISDYDTALPNTAFTPVNKDRLLKIVQEIPQDALDGYLASFPVRMHVDIPRVLESATVVWNESSDIGTQAFNFNKTTYTDTYSLGTNYSDTASSAASISADIQFVWKDYGNGNVMGTQYEFYLPHPVTTASILAKLAALGVTASNWPVFKTRSAAFTVMGQSIQVSCTATCGLNASRDDGALTYSGYEWGTNDKFGVNLTNNTVQIPSCLHGALSLGVASKSVVVSATADVSQYHSDLGTISAIITKSGTAYGSVTPSSIPATDVTDIPTSGLWLVDCNVNNYKWEHSLIRVQVFDASIFA